MGETATISLKLQQILVAVAGLAGAGQGERSPLTVSPSVVENVSPETIPQPADWGCGYSSPCCDLQQDSMGNEGWLWPSR